MKKAITIAALAGLSSAAFAGVPATVADFGLVVGSADATATIPAFGVDVFWISFEVGGGETYLDISTTFGSGSTDTEIGLFDAAGNVLGSDDDDGIGRASTLSYGTGSGLVLGDAGELTGGVALGGDGAMLSAGTYYVAFGGFNTTFTNGFGASSTFFDFDDAPMTLTVYSGVPTPASASLLALGGLACARRRRA